MSTMMMTTMTRVGGYVGDDGVGRVVGVGCAMYRQAIQVLVD